MRKYNSKNIAASLVGGLTFLLVLLTGLSACAPTRVAPETDQAASKADSNILKVAIRNAPSSYYLDNDVATGFDYELIKSFADQQGLELQLEMFDSQAEVLAAVKDGYDIGISGLPIPQNRIEEFTLSDSYLGIKQHVIYRKGDTRPRTLNSLTHRTLDTLSEEHHQYIAGEMMKHTNFEQNILDTNDTADLLAGIQAKKYRYALVDSHEYMINRAWYPQAAIAFTLPMETQLRWVISEEKKDALTAHVNHFLHQQQGSGEIAALYDHFYGHAVNVAQITSQTFNKNAHKLLPKYEKMIKRIAKEEGIDWKLLAAVSYQESHWNPKAKSRTGVRGMMMLTLPTAKEMGVTWRLDAEQSLRGGAKYLKKIHKRFDGIAEPDRTWMTLASYNIGMGHLNDAREITEFRGDNPDEWADVSKHLPLLTEKQWYKYTRYGYARGHEPVTYVKHIRHYYHLLNQKDSEQVAVMSQTPLAVYH